MKETYYFKVEIESRWSHNHRDQDKALHQRTVESKMDVQQLEIHPVNCNTLSPYDTYTVEPVGEISRACKAEVLSLEELQRETTFRFLNHIGTSIFERLVVGVWSRVLALSFLKGYIGAALLQNPKEVEKAIRDHNM